MHERRRKRIQILLSLVYCVPVSRFEFTDELNLKIGQWTICLAVKNARQNVVNQSENGYG